MFGDFWPKKHENLPKKIQSCKLFHPAGANPSPDFSEIYVLYVRKLSMQCIKIWFIGDKFVGQKL